MTERSPRLGIGWHAPFTASELKRLAVDLVAIWVGEMIRNSEIHPDTTPDDIEEFKSIATATIMTLLKSVDGLEDSLLHGTKATAVGFIGWFLRAVC